MTGLDEHRQEGRLTQEQSAALRVKREQENKDALAYVTTFMDKHGWSDEDRHAVVGALGLDGATVRIRPRKGGLVPED